MHEGNYMKVRVFVRGFVYLFSMCACVCVCVCTFWDMVWDGRIVHEGNYMKVRVFHVCVCVCVCECRTLGYGGVG